MVSNIGRVTFDPDFGSFTVKSIWGALVLRGVRGEQSIAVATINESIHLVQTS